jgi:hypothetical protein
VKEKGSPSAKSALSSGVWKLDAPKGIGETPFILLIRCCGSLSFQEAVSGQVLTASDCYQEQLFQDLDGLSFKTVSVSRLPF